MRLLGLILFGAGLLTALSGCKKQPTACFDAVSYVEVGTPLTFNNCSENADEFEWSFGDGTSSSVENASKTYGDAGTYTVTLQAKNGSETDEVSKTIEAIYCAGQFFSAYFEYEIEGFGAPAEVSFTYLTGAQGMTYLWNFGDGSTSTEQNPTHSYSAAGEYTVTLEAFRGTDCSRTSSEVVTVGMPSRLTVNSITVQSTTEPLVDGYNESPSDLPVGPYGLIGGTKPEVAFQLGACNDWEIILVDVVSSDFPQTIDNVNCEISLNGPTSFISYNTAEVDDYYGTSQANPGGYFEDEPYSSGSIDLSAYFSSSTYPTVISHSDGSFVFDLNVTWE